MTLRLLAVRPECVDLQGFSSGGQGHGWQSVRDRAGSCGQEGALRPGNAGGNGFGWDRGTAAAKRAGEGHGWQSVRRSTAGQGHGLRPVCGAGMRPGHNGLPIAAIACSALHGQASGEHAGRGRVRCLLFDKAGVTRALNKGFDVIPRWGSTARGCYDRFRKLRALERKSVGFGRFYTNRA